MTKRERVTILFAWQVLRQIQIYGQSHPDFWLVMRAERFSEGATLEQMQKRIFRLFRKHCVIESLV